MKQLLLTLLALLFVSTAATGQTTYYVNAAVGNDDTGHGTLEEPWATIQHAIDAVDDGDIVQIAAGTYTEMILIDKSITLIGEVNGEQRPVIHPPADIAKFEKDEKLSPPSIINVSPPRKKIKITNDVSISGIEVDGQNNELYKNGIHVGTHVVLNLNDVIVRNISSSGIVAGIRIESETAEITGCTITGIEAQRSSPFKGPDRSYNVSCGIFVETGIGITKEIPGKVGPSFPIKIAGNTINSIKSDDSAFGLSVSGIINAEVINNTINDIESEYAAVGIDISRPIIMVGKSNNGSAVFRINENEVRNVLSTIIFEDKSENNETYYLFGSYGIRVIGHQNATIDQNTVKNITSEGSMAHGISVDSDPFIPGPVIPGPFPPKKDNYLLEVTGNKVSDVFGIEPPMIFSKWIDYLPVGSACILVINAENVLVDNNEISADLDALTEKIDYDPFVGILIHNLEGDTEISKNDISNMFVGIYGLQTPNIFAAENIVTNCAIGISATHFPIPAELIPILKNNDLHHADLISIMEEQLADANKNNNGFTSDFWEFNENTVTGNIFGFMILLPIDEKIKVEEPKFGAEGNIVKDNNNGIYMLGSGGLHPKINNNTIQENDNYSIFYGVDPVYLADGKFNFWGSEDAPDVMGLQKDGVSNFVTENVLYSPWLGAEPGTTPMTYYVDDTGSIQDAIDLAKPGETIRILSGDYEGNVITVEKDGITLYPGDSPACVTILGDLTVTDQDVLRIDIDGTTVCDQYTQVTVEGDVNLAGIELDVQLGFVPRLGDEFDIIVSDNPINGQFAQGDEVVAKFHSVGVTFSVTYNDPDEKGDNSVTLTAIHIDRSALPISNLALFVLMGMVLLYFVLNGLKKRTSQA